METQVNWEKVTRGSQDGGQNRASPVGQNFSVPGALTPWGPGITPVQGSASTCLKGCIRLRRSRTGAQSSQLPHKIRVVRGAAWGQLCRPLGEQLQEDSQGEGPCSQGRGTGRWAGPRRSPRGYGEADPALAGTAEARLGQSRCPTRRGGSRSRCAHGSASGPLHTRSGSWQAGWGTPVHRGGIWAPEG